MKLLPRLFLLPAVVLPMSGQDLQDRVPTAPDTTYVDGNLTVFQLEQYGMTIAALPGGFDFLYFPKDPPPVARVADLRGYRYVVNGSYFDNSALEATPSGLLRVFGSEVSPLRADVQLTHVVRYDTASGRISFVRREDFTPDSGQTAIEFQTGPIVLARDTVADRDIQASINGRGRHPRTLLAATGGRRIYLITVRKPVALDSLAAVLRGLSAFSGGDLEVVNLDGGSSVALFSARFSFLNYHEHARLPLLLGIR